MKRSRLLGLLSLTLLFPLLLCGCDLSYDDDSGTAAEDVPVIALSPTSVLLTPAKLKEWIDNDYVDDWGYDVVVLDTGFDWSLDTRDVYDAGHIPGAHYVEVMAFYQDRSDGIVGSGAVVIDGPHMDALVQKSGIGEHTTVVFTGSHIWGTGRAYWTFRYWGFAKDQLFLLDGSANGDHSVWTDAGYELETAEPSLPTPSDFSVGDWPGNMDDVRASTEEFFLVAEGKVEDAVVLDPRSDAEWIGIIVPETNVFGLRVNNSVWRNWGEFLEGGQDGNHKMKSAVELGITMDMMGITESKTPYSFCQAGARGTIPFLVFDGLLNRSCKMHDGSTTELGLLGHLEDEDGNDVGLPEDSPWRFDLRKYCEVIAYHEDPAEVVPPVIVNAYAASAKAINEEDKLYHNRRKSLIEPETLKRWIDLGYKDDLGRDVVIFDTGFDWSMDTSAIYNAGHVSGAHHVQPMTFYANRSEGTVGFGAGVLEGAAMDAFIQPYGIDENSAIVFTGNHVWGTVRAYWTFRYWGFSQEQLFVLNGKANGDTSVWTDAGYDLQTAVPPLPIASTFSVNEWPGNMDAVRATTQEFMMVVDGTVPFSLVVDARSEEEWNAEVIAPETNVFGFRVKDSVWFTWGNVLEGDEDGDHVFKSAAELVEDLDEAGITSDLIPYSFCQGGARAAVLFFVFEEVLGRRPKMHDGSSMELGQMGHLNDGVGADLGLPEDSPWRFDTAAYCDEILYNDPAVVVPVVVIDAYAGAAVGVNETDKAYYTGD